MTRPLKVPFSPTEPFVPAPGLGHPHAQTLGAYALRRAGVGGLRRERWETPDGDFVDVDLLLAEPSRPHLLLLHGLEGSSHAGYVQESLRGAKARGWGAVALNFRSCSGGPNLLPRSYHSGATDDPLFVVERLRARGVAGPLLGLGFSLGGNVLLKLLADTGEEAPLWAAAAVSVPFDLQACARTLDTARGLDQLYRHVFLATLKRKALGKARAHPGLLEPARIRATVGIEAYDELVTARLHGFLGAADYYRRCSSGPLLTRIRRPTLLLSSLDDPLVPATSAPLDAARENPFLTVVRTTHGGHVGFLAGRAWAPRFWAEAQALAFLDAALAREAPRPDS